MRMYGGSAPMMGMNAGETLVVNNSSPLIGKLNNMVTSDKETAEQMASYIYKLSVLSQRKLSAEEMQEFLSASFDLLNKI